MRIVLACQNTEHADWLAHALGEEGFSVVVLSDIAPDSPELKGAELVILDAEAAGAIGEAGPTKRVLVSGRGDTVNLIAIQGKFADVLVIPAPAEEVIARINHVMGR